MIARFFCLHSFAAYGTRNKLSPPGNAIFAEITKPYVQNPSNLVQKDPEVWNYVNITDKSSIKVDVFMSFLITFGVLPERCVEIVVCSGADFGGTSTRSIIFPHIVSAWN